VLARVDVPTVADAVLPRFQAGEVGVALVTELEVGYSSQSRDYDATRHDLLDLLIPVAMPVRAEERARELQRDLVTRGQHRGVSVPDLVLAAIADIEELTILHYDADFDLISDVTDQPTEWVVPAAPVCPSTDAGNRRSCPRSDLVGVDEVQTGHRQHPLVEGGLAGAVGPGHHVQVRRGAHTRSTVPSGMCRTTLPSSSSVMTGWPAACLSALRSLEARRWSISSSQAVRTSACSSAERLS
jgi:predicted nucleic acid-binding protein